MGDQGSGRESDRGLGGDGDAGLGGLHDTRPHSPGRAGEVEIDLNWLPLASAMRNAIHEHKASLIKRFPNGDDRRPGLIEYWQAPDANHMRMMALAAIHYLRSLPVEQRMAAMGMIESNRQHEPFLSHRFWEEVDDD